MARYEVLLFAGLKEQAKSQSLVVELDAPSTVGQLLEAIAELHPTLAGSLQQCRVAVSQEFVDSNHAIRPEEEIALIPPVSGGHDGPVRIALKETPLSLADVVAAVEHRGAGGIATFTGNVRGLSRGQDIEHLDYEAYGPMALKAMTDIKDDIESKIEGTRVAIHHRTGRLHVGETAVVIAASAPHRAEAFEACRAAIEALKQKVPIWKKEVSTTGEEWIGRGP